MEGVWEQVITGTDAILRRGGDHVFARPTEGPKAPGGQVG